MERLWVCKEQSCEGAVIRSYDEVVRYGDPLCPGCDGNMLLTKASCSKFIEVIRGLSKTIRFL